MMTTAEYAYATDFHVDTWCDVFQAGRHYEDAEPVIAERWMVRATLPNGRRFIHRAAFRRTHFCECRGCLDYESDTYVPCKAAAADVYKTDAEAQEAAERLAARVRDAQGKTWEGPFNEHWEEVEPAYGSEEYEKQGCEANRAYWERREAGLMH